jgi:hypothetical protein
MPRPHRPPNGIYIPGVFMPIQCAGRFESTVCLHLIANNSAMRQSGDITAFE